MTTVSTIQKLPLGWLAGVRAPIAALFRPITALPLQVLVPLLLASAGVAVGVAWTTVQFPAAAVPLAGTALVMAAVGLFAPSLPGRVLTGARSMGAALKPAARPPVEVEPVIEAPQPDDRTVLGADISFVGRLSGEGEARILGRYTGAVRIARLEVGPGGYVEGDIACDEVDVHGTAVGDIRCDTVRARDGGVIEGRIAYRGLDVEYGADLDVTVGPLRRKARRASPRG